MRVVIIGRQKTEEHCRSAVETKKQNKMPRRRKPTTSSGSRRLAAPPELPERLLVTTGSTRRRAARVYRDRFCAILRFLWDTTKLTMVWLSFVWLAAHLFDEWSLRDARKYIDVAEQLATKSDLNGARDAAVAGSATYKGRRSGAALHQAL